MIRWVGIALRSMSLEAMLLCGITLSVADTVSAQAHDLRSSVVRVTVTPPTGLGETASGFLWQQSNRVVTSLHAVLAKGEIHVYDCLGVPVKAKIARSHRAADLVLLETEQPLKNCTVFRDVQEQKPQPADQLVAFGFYGDADSASTGYLTKKQQTLETLQGILPKQNIAAIKAVGMPDLGLDIYSVQGGLAPGMSGGPVFAKPGTGPLVGISDGGLDKGLSDYNWLIPARHLADLLTSTETRPSGNVSAAAREHFAAAFIAPEEEKAALEFDMNGHHYHFVKTKTRTLGALIDTADDPEGVRELAERYGPSVGGNLESRLSFDIYQDVTRGLIIAVPEGGGLQAGELQPGFFKLISDGGGGDGDIQYEEPTFFDAQGQPSSDPYCAPNSDGACVLGDDPGFLDANINDLIATCAYFDRTCERAYQREVDLGNGRKVLKVGIDVHGNNGSDYYEYYTFAVKGQSVFRAFALLWTQAGNDSLFNCFDQIATADQCANSELALLQLSKMIAVHLTTFADFGG